MMAEIPMLLPVDEHFIHGDNQDEFIELSCLLGEIFPDEPQPLERASGEKSSAALSPPQSQEKHLPIVSPSSSYFDVCGMNPSPTLEYPGYASEIPRPPPSVVSVEEMTEENTFPLETPSDESIVAEKKNSKKRSHSDAVSMPAHPPPTRQKTQRRERNREHAKKSRFKKKNFTKSLEQSVIELRAENTKIMSLVHAKFDREKTAKMVKERTVTPTDRFVGSLQKSQNRVLSNSAISYLRSLSKDCRL